MSTEEEGLFASHFNSEILPKTDVPDGELRPFSNYVVVFIGPQTNTGRHTETQKTHCVMFE